MATANYLNGRQTFVEFLKVQENEARCTTRIDAAQFMGLPTELNYDNDQ